MMEGMVKRVPGACQVNVACQVSLRVWSLLSWVSLARRGQVVSEEGMACQVCQASRVWQVTQVSQGTLGSQDSQGNKVMWVMWDLRALKGAPATKVNVVNKAEGGGQVGLAGQEFQVRKVSLASLVLTAHEELKDFLEKLCLVCRVYLGIKGSGVPQETMDYQV